MEQTSGRGLEGVDPEPRFSFRIRSDGALRVVELSGELDLSSRAAAIHACTSHDYLNLLVDLSGLVFMDCAGYGALLASATYLKKCGGSLALLNAVGEPRRLLALIEQLELGRRTPPPWDDPSNSTLAKIAS